LKIKARCRNFCQTTSTKQGKTDSGMKVHLNQLMLLVATLPCKMKLSPSRYTTTPKRDKNSTKKATNLLTHIVELSTAVVKVDIKLLMLMS